MGRYFTFMTGCPRLLGLMLALVLSTAGLPRVAAAPDDASLDASKYSYVLQPLDLLKVQVFQEPDLDRDVRVSKDHTIVLPLIGTVDLTNRTVHDAEQLITKLYGSDYLVNPQINITVTDYAQRSLNVLGAVNSPGSVLIPPERELTLVDAIARSGGFSRLANRTHVSLTRTLPNGDSQHFTINVDQLISGNAARQWVVQDGDVIFVPESVL
jgi:polysaccharide export outer membrane protein